VRRVAIVLVVSLAAGCGGAAHVASGPGRAAAARSAPAYAVVAPVLDRGGAPRACRAILTSLPPAGCSGIPVRGFDFEHVQGVIHFHGDGWETPTLRIVGVWNGHALVVTRVGRPGPAPAAPPAPARCAIEARPRGMALVRRIARDHAATAPMAFGPCGTTAWLLVPVADAATTRAVHRRYGDAVIVRGWLALDRAT
jgi:hypothetical protein